ncbi:MAG: HlyD family efflux transporter periplasmic adaptor subunit [Magnetococcales bacterium]|nr:HlyD family efflux transporter periplasmic adaptor subunit [Magnetococcales bacterium]
MNPMEPQNTPPQYPIRWELHTLPGPALADGAPTWTLHDPLRHRFFRLGWLEKMILDHPHIPPNDLIPHIQSQGGPTLTPEQIATVRQFLIHNELIQATDPKIIDSLRKRQQKANQFLRKLWQGWLFFRIPLWNPEPFLQRFSWLWQRLGHPITLIILVIAGVIGAVNTLRHWDLFLATFPHFFSLQGWLWYAIAIMGTRVAHELGHAATAQQMGCRVPTMGVAFMLFWPVLYTDVSEAWLLRARRKRMMIGVGGVATELGIAAIASLLWPFFPEGPGRSALVLLAGVAWIGTLVINLNPFMRFDGYFLLSDALGIPNLQQHAFALGQWRMRKWLFGWNTPPPTTSGYPWNRLLTAFAFATWIYRVTFFISFALLVYFLLFKVAGILMLLAEVGWFIVRPILLEMNTWWHHRHLFHWNRNVITSLLAATVLLSLLIWIPWEASVRAPAMARAGGYQSLFAPVPSVLVRINGQPNQPVAANQELLLLEAPDLIGSLEQNKFEINRLKWELGHQSDPFSPGDKQLVLQRELAAALSKEEGLLREKDRLRIHAPFAGIIKFVAEGLAPGVWIDPEQPLMAIMRSQPARIEAFVGEEEIDRIHHDTLATFIPTDWHQPRRTLKIERIERQAIDVIKDSALSSTFGGPLATRRDQKGRLIPEQGWFRIWLTPVTPWSGIDHVIPGTVRFTVPPRTVLERLWHPIWAALIRQTDF